MREQRGASLSGRPAIFAAALLCAVVLAIILGSIVAWRVAEPLELQHAQERRLQLANHYADLLAQYLWRYDVIGMQNQIQGLLLHGDIIGVRVEGDDGNFLISLGENFDSIQNNIGYIKLITQNDLNIKEKNKLRKIGSVKFVFKEPHEESQFLHEIAGVLAAAVAVALVILVVVIGYASLVRRPLRRIRAIAAAQGLSVDFLNDYNKLEYFLADFLAKIQAAEKASEAALELSAEATRVKAAFLANVSHELRTPLNGVIGLLTLLMEQPLTAQQNSYVRAALLSAESLLSLVSDLLDVAQLEEGKAVIRLAETNVQAMMKDAETLLSPRAAQRGNKLSCTISVDCPSILLIDEEKIRRILINMLDNAIKFTKEGEISAVFSFIKNDNNEEFLRLEVSDNGIGIPPHQLDGIFHHFSQVDASATRSHDGVGLGLAICRELCLALGGRLGVDSNLGAGSRFWVETPAKTGNDF